MCDILKGVILVMCYFMMHYVDYSMMYHLIRGQSVIKLYIIYNMLEVSRTPLYLPAQSSPHPHGLAVQSAFLPALVRVLPAFCVCPVTWGPC